MVNINAANSKILENLGLSHTESQVYLAMLELGAATANQISERAGIHRRTVYDILEMLIEKGLVSFIHEESKKLYKAESPETFLDILDKKKKEFQEILPRLLASTSNKEQEITVYRGKKGIRSIFRLMLKKGTTNYCFGSSGKFREVLGEGFYNEWLRDFVRNNCKSNIIVGKPLEGKLPKNIIIKKLADEYTLPASTTIWEDYVFIQIFSEKPIGILIKSKEVAESYLKYFNFIWNIAKL